MSGAPATSASRQVRFRDPRPPQAIQCELERDHMTLLERRMDGEWLDYRADAIVNGAPYRVHLRFEAALAQTLCYTLRIDIDWTSLPAATHDYHAKVAPSWLDLWLRRYESAPPPPQRGRDARRYGVLAQQALAFEATLADVPAIQRAVLQGLRDGGRYATSHKEGGTHIVYRHDRYLRSDHGEHPDHIGFTDEAAFLAHLRQFYDLQTSRSRHPARVDELTAWRLILRLLDPADPAGDATRRPIPAPRRKGP